MACLPPLLGTAGTEKSTILAAPGLIASGRDSGGKAAWAESHRSCGRACGRNLRSDAGDGFCDPDSSSVTSHKTSARARNYSERHPSNALGELFLGTRSEL